MILYLRIDAITTLEKSKMNNSVFLRAFDTHFIHKTSVDTKFISPCFRYTFYRAFDTHHRAFSTRSTVLSIHVLPCFQYTKRSKPLIVKALENSLYSVFSFFILLSVAAWKMWKSKNSKRTKIFLQQEEKGKLYILNFL